MTAWKSGSNPSPMSENTMRTTPIIYVLFSSFFWLGSKTLKIIIPIVTTRATTIFLPPSLRDASLTPEKRTPTNTTERSEHDLIIITTGKFVNLIAYE